MTPILFDDTEHLAAKTRTSVLGHVLLVTISALGLGGLAGPSRTWFFAGVILVFSVKRWALGRPMPTSFRRWYYLYASASIATAAAWGFWCALTIVADGPGAPGSLLLLLVGAGISAAGSNSLCANRRLASGFTFAVIAPVAAALAYRDWAGHWPVVAMLATYQLFLVLQIASANALIRDLRERNLQYRALVDSTHETILVHRDGKLLEANAAFTRTFDYPVAQFVNQNVYDLIHPDDRERALREANQDDGSRRVARIRHRLGNYLTVELRGRDLVYHGEPARVSCVNDISAQIEAEEAVRQSAEQRRRLADEREASGREALRLKSEFLANVGHEMRTPLNGIIGLTDLLENAPEGETRGYYLARLRTSGENLLALINDLLDFTELDAGRIDFADAPFDLRKMIERQCEQVAPGARAKGLDLGFACDADLPNLVRGDVARVGQVLGHLVTNALKFTERGHIRVTCRSVVRDEVSARVRFAVEDTGTGVPPEIAHRLFNPFTQGDSSTSRRHGGTGLGLSICKRLVEALGGQILFEAIDGGGTRFWFELPFATTGVEPALNRPAAVLAAGAKFTPVDVLVVEDNSTNQLLIMAVLTAMGLRPHAVANGVECLQITSERTFALIVMDCQMPEMDGYEATRRIRAREAHEGHHTPIVALTANVMQADRELCFACGMDAFVPKPVKRDKLFAELSRFLEVAGEAREKAS